MRFTPVLSTLACVPALADAWSLRGRATEPEWSPPGPDDVRAPCPMLNTLANHGFLPHNGKNLTKEIVEDGLLNALSIDKGLGAFTFNFGVSTNPTPNATFFNLDHLTRHNVLEHDASLSRADFYWGDAHTFNQTVFDETRSYWTGPVIDVQMAANARNARLLSSNKTNPTFSLSNIGKQFGIGESAAYLMLLGDKVSGTAPKALVEYLFENERLPFALGWTKPKDPVSQDDLMDMMNRVAQASGASPEQAAAISKRGRIHADES